MTRKPRLQSTVKFRVEGARPDVLMKMLEVQYLMIEKGHEVGPLKVYGGLSSKWNAPEHLESVTTGRRNIFLRCTSCDQLGVIMPNLMTRGGALSAHCINPKSD